MKKKLSIIMNILVIIGGLLGVVIAIREHMTKDFFLYYTNLSNVFAMITSLLFIITINKNNKLINILRFLSTVCLTLTLLVVIFILTPMLKVNLFVGNYMPLYHLICPLLSLVSTLFFEEVDSKPIYAIIPTSLYTIITIILNLLKIINGPYPFLKVNEQNIFISILWLIIILGLNYLIALVIIKTNKKIRTK